MSFTLAKFGFKIPEHDNQEKIINYILDTLNGNPIKVYSQKIILKNLSTDFLDKMKQEITRNFIEKNNRRTILTLGELNQTILKELFFINKIEINLGIHQKNSKYKFGNGILTNHYLDIVNNLLLTKYKSLFEEYFEKNLLKFNSEKEDIFDTLKEFENYKYLIFDEFKLFFSTKISKLSYPENPELPKYLDLINQFNYLYFISGNLKKLIITNFPKKNYNSCYLEIVEKQLKIVEKILNLTNLSFLELYYPRISKTLNLLYQEKDNYNSAYLGKILNSFFNKIEIKNYQDFDKLIKLSSYVDKTGILQPCILNFISKNSKSKEFIEKFVDYYLQKPLIVDSIIHLWFNNFNQKEYFLIYLKNKLISKIWNLNQLEITTYLKFFNSVKIFSSAQKMISMLNDLKNSQEYSSRISPQKIYLFSQGVWDYVFHDEIFDSGTQSFDHPLINQFLEINSKIQKDFSTLYLYYLKGSIKLEYQDNNKQLTLTCLPAQAFVLKYLEENSYSKKELQESSLKNLTEENLTQILETLEESKLIYLNNQRYYLMEDLSLFENKENYLNLAEKFFITSKLDEKIKDTSSRQLILSFNEVCPTVINHLVKINPLTLTEICQQVKIKLEKHYQIEDQKEIKEVIEEMMKKDLIYQKDELYFKLT